MSRELSSVLDHIEKISELDLEGVPPTSHVVEVENVLRADEPRPSWPAERVLEQAPGPGRRRVPGSEPGPVSADVVELTAAEAIERIVPATSAPGSSSRPTASASSATTATWARSSGAARGARRAPRRPARRRAAGGQGPVLHGGRSDRRGIAASSRGTGRCTRRRLSAACRGGAPMIGKTNMDEFAMGSSNENTGYRPLRNPGTASAFPAARAVGRPPRSPRGSPRGRSAPTRAARSASRRRCAASSG